MFGCPMSPGLCPKDMLGNRRFPPRTGDSKRYAGNCSGENQISLQTGNDFPKAA